MRIDQKSSLPAAGVSGPARRGSVGQRFAVAENGAGAAATIAAAAPPATMDAILAMQAESDPGERKRRSVQRGSALLDALDRLKAALLTGRVAAVDLQAIAARLAERREMSGDPRLDELVLHIELRAQVEMAKLQMR